MSKHRPGYACGSVQCAACYPRQITQEDMMTTPEPDPPNRVLAAVQAVTGYLDAHTRNDHVAAPGPVAELHHAGHLRTVTVDDLSVLLTAAGLAGELEAELATHGWGLGYGGQAPAVFALRVRWAQLQDPTVVELVPFKRSLHRIHVAGFRIDGARVLQPHGLVTITGGRDPRTGLPFEMPVTEDGMVPVVAAHGPRLGGL